MIALAVMTRDTGMAASERLGIKDELTAIDFDFAVSIRLFRLEQQERQNLAKMIAYECSKIFIGSSETDDSILDSDVLANDPYADKDTQTW